MSENFNPFAALIEENNAGNEIVQKNKNENNVGNIIENIFGFTLNPETSQQKQYVYLEDVSNSFSSKELDINILEHALFERLFLTNPEDFILQKNCNNNSVACEGKVITYLFHTYKNTFDNVDIEIEDKNCIKGLILRNVVTALKQPVLYSDQDVFIQLYEILNNELPIALNFLQDIYKEFIADDDGFESLEESFIKLLKLIHIDVAKASVTTLNPSIYESIKLFTTNIHLALIFFKYCKPSKPDVGIEYANTLLGALFSISILPKTAGGSYDFFQNPMDMASNMGTEGILWTNMNNVTELIHSLLLNLLKCSPSIKMKTLEWLGGCLKANTDRGKLWNAQAPDLNPANFYNVSDGFMINFSNVLLRLCQPFCSNIEDKKIYKVDPTYCAVPNESCSDKGIHLLDMSKETCLVPVSVESDEDNNQQERLTASNYNFVTECFFMSHRALDLGYRVTVDKLVRLNQDMGRIERAYNEALSQAGGMTDVVDSIKERMKSELSKYLSVKAQLSEPNLLKMLFDFITATASWLIQIVLHTDIKDSISTSYAPLEEKNIIFPISTTIPDTLKCIPEFVIENIVCYLVFLRRFNPKVFEEQGYERLHPILSCILIYMGSAQHMRNPHLRARLAEALESLLPYHKDEPPGLNTLGSYQRERLFLEYPHRKEIVRNLLDVFVGIEMTGQSVQFEQKFNYRRPMYMVIDYLWKIDEYQGYFKLLAEEAEINMEAVTPPLFLRFVNLLMNDAVFLLDEALANMAKLREMQTARENGEWDIMPAQERAQNMGYMQQVGIMARFDNILGRDTIRTIEQLTSKITIVFTHNTMVDRVAAMLNYFLFNLVGPNKKNFKVKDQKEYSFDPAAAVLDICQIYVNLKECDSFCLAISQDGRSYNPQLFSLAEDVLVRIGGGALVGELQDVASRVAKKAVEYQESEEAIAEAPEHFFDPIMSTLMSDPVILPSSKQTVDRTTIARHLLSDQTDPFNRAPLSMDQVIPNSELAEEIRLWLQERKK